jgi:hypothetical protein
MATWRSNVSMIPASRYPAVLRGTAATEFSRFLRSDEGAERAQRVIVSRKGEMRVVVFGYIGRLAAAERCGDSKAVFAEAHEIRGIAETAGLTATGRIADGLCRYLDAAKTRGCTADASVIALHVESISRAASAEDEATKLGGRVIAELSMLAVLKLDSVNDLERVAASEAC